MDFGPGVGVKNLFPKNLAPATEKLVVEELDIVPDKDGVVLDAKDLLDSLMGEKRNSSQKPGGGPSEEFYGYSNFKFEVTLNECFSNFHFLIFRKPFSGDFNIFFAKEVRIYEILIFCVKLNIAEKNSIPEICHQN